MATANASYVFDQNWQRERDRLQSLERLFDPSSQRHLAARGLATGWRCLEVGCGAGSLALWLADQVGPTGSVVASDVDPRFIDASGRANLEVRQHDLMHDPIEAASYDLVHARAVVEHIPDHASAIRRLVDALKPGGWLVLEDVDFGGAAAAVGAHYVHPAEHAALTERLFRVVELLFNSRGADASFGPRLPSALIAAGLDEVLAEVHAPLVQGGSSDDWGRLTVEQLRRPAVATGQVTDADIETFLEVTSRTTARYLPPLMVTAWGKRVA